MGLQERNRQKRIKEYVINRDGMICCYCDFPLTKEQITLEHIVPDSHRGTFNTTNLTISCGTCNNKRGNKPFFDYCKKFNWSEDKLDKYKRLYLSNLRIKVLNIAKEECLPLLATVEDKAVPLEIIEAACHILKIRIIDFSHYEKEYFFSIKFDELAERKRIKFCFEQLIRILEAEGN
jgi:HNH endonuclease